jgi:hypothetical protein
VTEQPERTEDAAKEKAAHENARLRGPRRLLLVGSGLAVLLAMAAGAAGADGRAGFVLLLLVLAAVCGLAGLWVAAQLLVDEFRGGPSSRRRGLFAVGMFVAALVCMTAVAGVARAMGVSG